MKLDKGPDATWMTTAFQPNANGRRLIIVATVLPDGQTMVNEASQTGVWLPTSQYWPTFYMLQKVAEIVEH